MKAGKARVRTAPYVISAVMACAAACQSATASRAQPTAANNVAPQISASSSTQPAAPAAPGPPASTAVPPTAAQTAGPLHKTVVLDPGHNGGNENHPAEVDKLVPQGFGQYKACDTTGTNAHDGYSEHEFNFQVALLVQSLLKQRGITVVLSRSTDDGVGPCVDQRAALGNDAHADAAVSIHGDGNEGGHGYHIIETSRSAGGTPNDTRSHRLALDLHQSLTAESGLTPSTYAGVNGFESRDDLAGLNLSTVPKVLVECGNMHDQGDAALMESAAGRQRIARAISDGIVGFLGG